MVYTSIHQQWSTQAYINNAQHDIPEISTLDDFAYAKQASTEEKIEEAKKLKQLLL
jgi:hypothetical protein